MSKKSKKPAEEIIEDEEEEEIPEEYLHNNQDKSERMRIRTEYRELIKDLDEKKHEAVNPDSDTLDKALDKANTLNKNVRSTREGALDASTILHISMLGRQRVDNLNTDFMRFEPIEYAEKLIAFIQRENPAPSVHESPISPEGWKNLGAAGQKLFSKNPPFHFMAGSFDRDVKEKPAKAPKVRSEKDNQVERETVPRKMDSFDDSSGKNEATTAEVEKVLDILQTLYRQENENPICFFEFVTNPDSFGQTIENIFYTSFLVKDGLARVSLDEDNLPIIEPMENAEDGTTKQQKTKNKQTIISMTPREWREIVNVYKIESPLIPTRAEHTDRPPTKKSHLDTSRSKGKK